MHIQHIELISGNTGFISGGIPPPTYSHTHNTM